MNINTGKLASNSELFLKKLKEQESVKNVTSEKEGSKNLKQKLLNDFADIKFGDNAFKGRLLSNNLKLSKYEYEYSKNQFVEEKLNVIQDAYKSDNLSKVNDIIDSGVFNNKNVLKDFFMNNEDIKIALSKAKDIVDANYKTLSKEYKSIEIASQNILSINQDTATYSIDSIKDVSPDTLLRTTRLNSVKISELIS